MILQEMVITLQLRDMAILWDGCRMGATTRPQTLFPALQLSLYEYVSYTWERLLYLYLFLGA